MKYKAGDRVKIKSFDWYNENKDINGNIHCGDKVFDDYMSVFCGSVVTIDGVYPYNGYCIREDMQCRAWTDEMIEGLAEDETKPLTYEETAEIIEAMQGIGDSWECPQGYQFVDENGNVIKATKIVLEKKKKEYPKTYEECCDKINFKGGFKEILLNDNEYSLYIPFIKLKRCRDAYWKLYGEEMELGKPWEPSDSDYITGRCCIFVHRGNIICDTPAQDCVLTFPTPEMRDAFYENFKELIESVKELL